MLSEIDGQTSAQHRQNTLLAEAADRRLARMAHRPGGGRVGSQPRDASRRSSAAWSAPRHSPEPHRPGPFRAHVPCRAWQHVSRARRSSAGKSSS